MTKQERIKTVVDYIANLPYGEIITHDKLAYIADVKQKSQDYRDIMFRAAKRLIDHGHIIKNIRGVGYQVIDPDDYSALSVKHAVRGAKLIDKGVKVMRNAPVSDMTQEGRTRYNAVNDRLTILQAAVTGAKVEITMLESKRPHPLASANR